MVIVNYYFFPLLSSELEKRPQKHVLANYTSLYKNTPESYLNNNLLEL